jgi:hypothetical protein
VAWQHGTSARAIELSVTRRFMCGLGISAVIVVK